MTYYQNIETISKTLAKERKNLSIVKKSVDSYTEFPREVSEPLVQEHFPVSEDEYV